jgi:hypothetical protein
LIIESIPEKRHWASPPIIWGQGFSVAFPFWLIRSTPLPKAVLLLRFSVFRDDGKASGNGRERINRNGMATETAEPLLFESISGDQ